MSVTEALVPSQDTLKDFLAEVKKIQDDFDATRPPWWRWLAASTWSIERGTMLSHVAAKYGQDLKPIEPEIVELVVNEAQKQLIRSSCVEKKEKDKRVKFNFHKIFSFTENQTYIKISFVIKSGNEFKISRVFCIGFEEITVVTGLSIDEQKFFSAKITSGDAWSKDVKFHVHSEDDVSFLFK